TYRHVFISLVSYTTTIYTLSLHDALPIYIFTNLGTRPHSCPGIDHGAFIDVCTDIYIGRHKNNPFSKKCTIASQTVWNNPYTKRSEEHTSELQSREKLVCRLLLEKKKRHD